MSAIEEIIEHFRELPPTERADAYETLVRNLHAEAEDQFVITGEQIVTHAQQMWQGRKSAIVNPKSEIETGGGK